MIDPQLSTGRLSIVGASATVNLHTYAWTLLDLTALWVRGAKRGQDRLLPTAAGVIPYRRRSTVTQYLLDLTICGETDQTGALYADPWIGLETNLAYLVDQLVADPATTAGTRAATLTMPSGNDRHADVHVTAVEDGPTFEGLDTIHGHYGVVMAAKLALSVPAGYFA